jgi:hypothetical protein
MIAKSSITHVLSPYYVSEIGVREELILPGYIA